MKKTMTTGVAMGLLMSAALVSQPASANEALAKKGNCTSCHAVDKKVVGPAFKDVAAKYKGDAGAVDTLVAKVKTGGSGVWGEMPMPPTAGLSDEEIRTLVTWILAM